MLKDFIAGGLLVIFGALVIIISSTYGLGTLAQMESGSFPFAIGCLLAVCGLLLFLTNVQKGWWRICREDLRKWCYLRTKRNAILRGIICISVAIIVFILALRYSGLIAASFLVTFCSAFANSKNTWRGAAMIAVIMTLISVIIFHWGFNLNVPLY